MRVTIREMPSQRQVRALGDRALARGDHDLVMICWQAWNGDRDALVKVAEVLAQEASRATE